MSFNITTDATVGGAGASFPLWFNYVESGVSAYLMVGGIILISIRVALALREWRNSK